MGTIGLRGGLGACAKYHCLWLSCFFVSSTRLQIATVDRFSRSRPTHQTTRFRTRKCLLGISMMNFHINPLSPPKFENLHYSLVPMATSNGNNSGIFEDRSKLFAPKGSSNLMPSSKFASDRPLLPWQPSDCFWAQNWLKLYISLYIYVWLVRQIS